MNNEVYGTNICICNGLCRLKKFDKDDLGWIITTYEQLNKSIHMNSEVYGIIMSICNGRCRLKKLVKDDLDLVNKYL